MSAYSDRLAALHAKMATKTTTGISGLTPSVGEMDRISLAKEISVPNSSLTSVTGSIKPSFNPSPSTSLFTGTSLGVDTSLDSGSSAIETAAPPAPDNSWLSNAGSSISSGASSLVNKAVGTTTDVGKAFSDAKGMVLDQTNSNKKTLSKTKDPWNMNENDKKYKDLFPIGRPCRFNGTIDQYQRFGNYLKSKMSVIDLIPVDYGIDFANMVNMVKGKEWADKAGKLLKSIYSIGYDEKIKKYETLCDYHGLKKYAGIRLFTTDDTTASDTIQINYAESILKKATDPLSSAGQTLRDVANSIGGSRIQTATQGTQTEVVKIAGSAVEALGGGAGMKAIAEGVASVASDIVLNGNKMTFPKIWQESSYDGNLSVNVRLVSPYGHPKAVKEFIMKPLSYLILLSAPQTINGVTYGGSIPITIKAYGLNYTVLGSIASITFRRGGSDTSFNLYKQPLTIDLSITFQTLFSAFAVYDPTVLGGKLKTDRNIFKNDTNLSDPGSLNLWDTANKDSLMVSLGTVLASLRPVRIVGMGTNVDPQVYGMFQAPSRTDIPDAPGFNPLTGNLGSSISSAVSAIGSVASLVTNAPKLIQQGLSNAVYNTAKSSVSSIAGTASGWLNKTSSAATSVVNKITGNFL